MGYPAEKPRHRATYEDLLQVPDTKITEIIDGELIVSPRPSSPHAIASSQLGAQLGGSFGRKRGSGDRPGGWWILDEPELHLDDDVVVPDLAGWTRDRLPTVPNVPYFTLAPDWVCEVSSPSNSHIDRVRKMPIYARERVTWMWLIHPADKTMEIYRREGSHWLLLSAHHGDTRIMAPPFDAIELDLYELWLDDAPPATER